MLDSVDMLDRHFTVADSPVLISPLLRLITQAGSPVRVPIILPILDRIAAILARGMVPAILARGIARLTGRDFGLRIWETGEIRETGGATSDGGTSETIGSAEDFFRFIPMRSRIGSGWGRLGAIRMPRSMGAMISATSVAMI
jgi:hypothetical protein